MMSMTINDYHLSFLHLVDSMGNSISYSKINSKIKKERRRYSGKLPISIHMLYKRAYELRNKGYIETEAMKVFPTFSLISLTEKALNLIKSVPILQKIMEILSPSPKIKKSIIQNKKNSQKNLLSFLPQKENYG